MPSSHWFRRHIVLPPYAYVVAYPYEVVTTRSSLSHLVPRPPEALESESPHVILAARDQVTAQTKENSVPADKWIKPTIPAYATPVSTPEKFKNKEGSELVGIEVTPSDLSPIRNYGMARRIFKREGIFGFYRGFLHNYLMEVAELSLTKACTDTNTKLLKKAGEYIERKKNGKAIEESGGDKAALSRSKICLLPWRKIPQMGITSGNAGRFCSIISVATIMYPLRTIALRCRVYEPIDRIHLSYLQMARTSLIIDGVGSLYQGYGHHISAVAARGVAKLMTDVVLENQHVPRYWRFLCRSLESIADIIVRPLEDRASEEQCVSGIPGLVPKLTEGRTVWSSMVNEKVAGDCALATALILFQELVMSGTKENNPNSDIM